MSVNAEPSSKLDTLKWLVVFTLVGVAVWGDQHYAEESIFIRGGALIVIAIMAIFVGLSATKGRNAWELIKDSNIERRKVVWPVRQEAVKTTGVVFVVVVLVGFMLWVLDYVFNYLFIQLIGSLA